jgi:RNA polymerase sigma-70 factor (ECF subfamily)
LNIVSDEPGPDRQMGARQELDRLRVVVAALPGQCRRVFELRKFEGLSHRDVANRMGLSEKTIENHLTRALARITEVLAACTNREQSERVEPSARPVDDTKRGID